MKIRTLLLAIACLFTFSDSFAQYNWVETTAPQVRRYDDIFFLNADTGWAICPYSSFWGELGSVIKTTDGGQNWTTLWDSAGAVFRSMAFLDADLGFIGNLESGLNPEDTLILYKTTDGGQTWAGVPNLPGPRPGGICGMYRINDSTLYAGGRYYGPATFYKTTDRGDSWTAIGLDSLAGGLVDMYFWNADSGIVVGSSGLPYNDSASVILFTSDGGQSWERKYRGADREICWKISFPSPKIGYVSVQSVGQANRNFLKTTDQGQTWTSGFFDFSIYVAQGIGFVNDSTGWIGGNPGNQTLRFTQDWGQNWSNVQWGQAVNRFRFVNDSLAYAGGAKIYRMELLPNYREGKGDPILIQMGPNPSEGNLHVQIPDVQGKTGRISVWDSKGKEIAELWRGVWGVSSQSQSFDLKGVNAGVYFVRVEVEGSVYVRKLLLRP